MHAWYSRKGHLVLQGLRFSGVAHATVSIVVIDGVEKLATFISNEFSGGENYGWDDKVYLGGFDTMSQRVLSPYSVCSGNADSEMIVPLEMQEDIDDA